MRQSENYEAHPVPFVTVDNRRCLTAMQLAESPELAAFVRRFPASFETDPARDVVWFIEPEAVSGIIR